MTELFYSPVDPAHIKIERQKARDLRSTPWWNQKLTQGICHYCEQKFAKDELTMDHIVPVGRGGKSTKGNIVCACKTCNSDKKSKTPAELLLQNLALTPTESTNVESADVENSADESSRS